MKLSKSSMLYRSAELYSVVGSEYYGAKDLCTFVRRYLFRIAVSTILAFVAGFLASCILFFIICILTVGYWDEQTTMFVIGWALTASLLIVSGLIGIFCMGHMVYNYLVKKRYDDEEEREPGIIATYLKARKEKYCPTLEFTE